MARNLRNHSVKQHSAMVSQVAGTNTLPTLPNVTIKLLETLAEPNVSSSELADVVRLDPALSVKVMQLAQSTTHRSVDPIPNAASATQLVGIDSVAQLVNWSSTLDVFNTFSFCSPRDLTDFWAHSVKCALSAEALAREVDYHDPDNAFLAGLLHDVGKLLLLTYFPTKYKLSRSEEDEDEEGGSVNDSLFDDDHASAGAALVRRWRNHSFTADAIHYHHHSPDAVASAFPLVKIVYVANLLAKPDHSDSESLSRSEAQILDLDTAQFEAIIESTNSAFDEICKRLGIDPSSTATEPEQSPSSYAGAHTTVVEHVRDASLLGTLAFSLLNANDTDEVMQLVEQALQAHFDVDTVAFLLADKNDEVLTAHGQDYEHVGGLSIPLSQTDCDPVRALTDQKVVDSFTARDGPNPSIMNDQLVHLMGAEGMLCLPMAVGQDLVGTIVLGIDRADLANFSSQKRLLSRFSRYAAKAIRKSRSQTTDDGSAQQASLQSVTELNRRAVHEINNPLGIINNYLTVLGRRLAEQNLAHDEIRIIREEIERIRSILLTLSESSKQASVSLEPVDLNAVLSDLLALMKEDLTEQRGIKLHSHLNPSIPRALTDKDILKQAVINLLKNSAEALPDGGNIHIETLFASDGNNGTQASDSSNNHRGEARLIIRDDGPGIPETVRARLFQPFVTSKQGHEGLGLSIVHSLVEKLSGTISCDPETDSGTQFTIYLPVVDS